MINWLLFPRRSIHFADLGFAPFSALLWRFPACRWCPRLAGPVGFLADVRCARRVARSDLRPWRSAEVFITGGEQRELRPSPRGCAVRRRSQRSCQRRPVPSSSSAWGSLCAIVRSPPPALWRTPGTPATCHFSRPCLRGRPLGGRRGRATRGWAASGDPPRRVTRPCGPLIEL